MNDAMLDVAPQEGAWGHAMALGADGLTLHALAQADQSIGNDRKK